MTAKIIIQILSFTMAIIAVGCAINQLRATERHRAKLADITKRRVFLERHFDVVHPPGQTAMADMPVDSPNAASVTAEAVSHAGASSHISENIRPELIEALLNDPKLQSLYLDAQRASIGALYAPLIRQLGLSPELAEQIYDRVMERNEQRMDLADVMASNEATVQDTVIAALEEKNSNRFRAALSSLLGAESYQHLQAHERALPAWDVVNRFAGVAALEGRPLDLQQASALTDVIAKSSPPYRAGGIADTNNLEWNSILQESREVLTTLQYESFKNMAPRYPAVAP